MIDWHSHILPGMDDGSRDITESIMMLDALQEQGAECVIATPHFYANEESVNDFLNRRKQSYAILCKAMKENHPRLLCGAEVRYYPGISRMSELERLTVGSTNLLLLEMPMSRWTEYTVKELIELACTRGVVVILAHIERYMTLQDNGVFNELYKNELLMQVNASFFERMASRKRALKLLASGKIHFVGSDCHNMTTRAPKIGTAYEIIGKKFGESYISQINEYGYRMLEQQ